MSLQWTLVAAFLYVEIAIIFIFLLSIIRPKTWKNLFNSRFIQSISAQSHLYLFAFIAILFLFFIDAIREMHKYSNKVGDNDRYYGSAAFHEDQMRLFRGQRNFYISGFSLFCLFIIKRLAGLISQQATFQAQAEASTRQLENLSKSVEQNLTGSSSSSGKKESKKPSQEDEGLLLEMKEKMSKLVEENEKLTKNLSAIKSQAEATNKEYDRLTEDYAELQNKYDKINEGRDR